MIGCFVKSLGPEVSELLCPYVWAEAGFFSLFDARFKGRCYGDERLSLVLYLFYVEGSFAGWLPERLSLSKYSPKDRSIGVYVPVRRSTFHSRSNRVRRQFIVAQIRTGLQLVEARMHRRKFSIDFVSLRADVERVIRLYVEPAAEIG